MGEKADTVKKLLRSIITAPEGKSLFVADFASVEARIIFWLAEQDDALNLIRDGLDIYLDMAGAIFNGTFTKEDEYERNIGKFTVLGGGCGMGPSKFQAQCASYGTDISDDLANKCIQSYRTRFYKVKAAWKQVEFATLSAIQSGSAEWNGIKFRIAERFNRPVLCIELPSGRSLHFWHPEIVPGKYGPQPQFQTLYGTKFFPKSYYGALIFQNIVQAIARDLMIYGDRIASESGFTSVMSVHDELVSLGDSSLTAEQYANAFGQTPEWAAGLPIEAEAWKGIHYKK